MFLYYDISLETGPIFTVVHHRGEHCGGKSTVIAQYIKVVKFDRVGFMGHSIHFKSNAEFEYSDYYDTGGELDETSRVYSTLYKITKKKNS